MIAALLALRLAAVDRRPHIRGRLAREYEFLRKHANHRGGCSVERDRPSDHARVAGILTLPEGVAQHGDARRTDVVLAGSERPADRRAHAEHVEEVRGGLRAADRLRLVAAEEEPA